MNNFSILCVDDEADVLASISEVLEARGIRCLTATGAETAMSIITEKSDEIALVLSDFTMPDGDGFELRRRLLENFKNIPFVILSGQVTRDMALSAVELKIAAFIDKPFKGQELAEVIERESRDRVAQLLEEQELLTGFVSDADNLLSELETLILGLENNPHDLDAVNRIFGIVHTLKGASGFFQPDNLHRFAHRLEDSLSKIKTGETRVSAASVTALLAALDIFKALTLALKTHDHRDVDIDKLIAQIVALAAQAENKSGQPDIHTSTPSARASAFQTNDELKVSIRVLDEFMELSGEITVLRNMVKKITRSLDTQLSGNRDVAHLSELIEQMNKTNTIMQDKVADLRRVPMKSVYRPLQRIIRDLGTSLMKDITLAGEDEGLRIDHSLADSLSSSLVHMIRNSSDHGIELPEERVAAGKPRQGTVRIKAKESGEFILLEISDDGRGVDPEKIRKKIVEKNLVSVADAAKMSAQNLVEMIFAAGFSTAATVTDVSGRGVGMDMVKASIERVGGTIEVTSEVNRGTCFRMRLPKPKSILIIDSLLVRIGKETFGIPQDSILRVLRIPEADREQLLGSLEGAQVLRLEGEMIPIVWLGKLLEIPQEKSETSEILNFIIVRSKSGPMALGVDEVIDIEDTVVKRIKQTLGQLTVYSGATFLGDGHVGLIIDIEGLASHSGLKNLEARRPPPEAKSAPATSSVLQVTEGAYLIVDIPVEGVFGVPLAEVYRLEFVPQTEIQKSGEFDVFIYREQSVPILNPVACLGFEATRPIQTREDGTIPVVVISTNGRLFGFRVTEIKDVITPEVGLDASFRDQAGIRGNITSHGHNVSVLDLSILAEQKLSSVIAFQKTGT